MNALKFTITLLFVGFILAAQGNDVVCTGSGNSCSVKCPQLPDGLSWVQGQNENKCAVNNCPSATDAAKYTGISNLYCQSCPGKPNGSVSAIYVNVGNTACVASSAPCDKSRPNNTWNREDCIACVGSNFSIPSADKSQCTANASILAYPYVILKINACRHLIKNLTVQSCYLFNKAILYSYSSQHVQMVQKLQESVHIFTYDKNSAIFTIMFINLMKLKELLTQNNSQFKFQIHQISELLLNCLNFVQSNDIQVFPSAKSSIIKLFYI
ncbi:hypothetical protein ABPG74_013049 [Tetrahymena malaccensis]